MTLPGNSDCSSSSNSSLAPLKRPASSGFLRSLKSSTVSASSHKRPASESIPLTKSESPANSPAEKLTAADDWAGQGNSNSDSNSLGGRRLSSSFGGSGVNSSSFFKRQSSGRSSRGNSANGRSFSGIFGGVAAGTAVSIIDSGESGAAGCDTNSPIAPTTSGSADKSERKTIRAKDRTWVYHVLLAVVAQAQREHAVPIAVYI